MSVGASARRVGVSEPLMAIEVLADADAAAGDGRSFDDFYRAEFRRVLALVYGLTGRRHAAEELTQDAFIEAHRRWVHVSRIERPDAWVRTVALNRARSWGRRASAETRALTRFAGQRRAVPDELSEPAEQLWVAVRRLPRRQAEVVALKYIDDLPVAEIAALLDISEGSVKTHLSRGRAALAEQLKDER